MLGTFTHPRLYSLPWVVAATVLNCASTLAFVIMCPDVPEEGRHVLYTTQDWVLHMMMSTGGVCSLAYRHGSASVGEFLCLHDVSPGGILGCCVSALCC